MSKYQDSGTSQRCHIAGIPWVVVVDIDSGFVRVELVTPVCCADAYATEGPKARSVIPCWHSEVKSDNHHQDGDYARRAVDTASTPAS